MYKCTVHSPTWRKENVHISKYHKTKFKRKMSNLGDLNSFSFYNFTCFFSEYERYNECSYNEDEDGRTRTRWSSERGRVEMVN